MLVPLSPSAVMLWRGLRLGPLHFTPYGLAAALGLSTSMGLARRCAVRSGTDPEAIWDAGLFAIFSCFVTSRLLLALENPAALWGYPLVLLGFPSLTSGGIALAALAAGIYLRRKRLPFLRTLDTFAAPAALLAALLELGHWAEGSEEGMPTRLPWGVSEGAGSLRVHPVALYGAVLSLALAIWLWTALPRMEVGRGTVSNPGRVSSLALMAGGFAAFILDMLSAPYPGRVMPWLEPGQWIALATMLAGGVLWALGPVEVKALVPGEETPLSTLSPLHSREVQQAQTHSRSAGLSRNGSSQCAACCRLNC